MALDRWRQIGQRLSRMERAELRERARQEIAKRQDVALSWVGYDFGRISPRATVGKAGNFFFSPESVDSILALLRQKLPAQVERIVKQADKICRHRFDLLGYTDLDFGTPIDWHLDAVHGQRAPRKPFYTVRYLDYAEVGDSKVTWELNRHQHLVTLAKAFRLTNDLRFADEILRQWRHWQEENPYPKGINWASSLEVALRALSWMWTHSLLQGAPGVPDFRDEWLRGLALHGRHIERYLSTYFSPNTHLLGEGVGLFFLGVLYPELAGAESWKARGWEIVVREVERQVRPDGFHFEQSTYYHVYALDMFLHCAVLASVNGIDTPKVLEEKIEKMLAALSRLGRGGPPPRFGDDDGGRLFDPQRNRSEHMLDPLATGAILFHRGEFKAATCGLREETLWLLGEEGVRQWDALEEVASENESGALNDAGIYLLSTAKNTQLVVDAGPLGTQSGGHGHADALSVCLQSAGHSLLIDTGTFEYVGPAGDRDLFRGTAMHNTVRVDRANQAEASSPFSWKRLTETKVERWIQGNSFDLLVASHDGYQRLAQPVTHRRWVVSLRNGIYLIRDVITGEGKHRLDLTWHLAPEMQLVAEGIFRVKGASQGLALLPAKGHRWAEEVVRESCSPAYGQKAPMTTVNYGIETTLPAEFGTLLVTLEEVHGNAASFARIEGGTENPGVSEYSFALQGVDYSLFFGERGKVWRKGSISSDAEFVCRKGKPGRGDSHLILWGGRYARINSGSELRCTREVEWAELRVEGAECTVHSSDADALTAADTVPDPETTVRDAE